MQDQFLRKSGVETVTKQNTSAHCVKSGWEFCKGRIKLSLKCHLVRLNIVTKRTIRYSVPSDVTEVTSTTYKIRCAPGYVPRSTHQHSGNRGDAGVSYMTS